MKDRFWQKKLPWYVLYAPLTPWILKAFVRRRFKLSSVNPCMDNSGLINSSKTKYLSLLPKEWVPEFNPTTFPMVLKPDNGERGKGVKIIHNEADYNEYMANANGSVLAQSLVGLPNECGIFWTDDGITSITLKRFKRGQPIGSHNLGTTFLNGRKHITPKLNDAIREIVDSLPGFTYGRLDVKYNSFSDLESLKNFKILEINGVNSELTHCYEPGYSLWSFYRETINNWKLI